MEAGALSGLREASSAAAGEAVRRDARLHPGTDSFFSGFVAVLGDFEGKAGGTAAVDAARLLRAGIFDIPPWIEDFGVLSAVVLHEAAGN